MPLLSKGTPLYFRYSAAIMFGIVNQVKDLHDSKSTIVGHSNGVVVSTLKYHFCKTFRAVKLTICFLLWLSVNLNYIVVWLRKLCLEINRNMY